MPGTRRGPDKGQHNSVAGWRDKPSHLHTHTHSLHTDTHTPQLAGAKRCVCGWGETEGVGCDVGFASRQRRRATDSNSGDTHSRGMARSDSRRRETGGVGEMLPLKSRRGNVADCVMCLTALHGPECGFCKIEALDPDTERRQDNATYLLTEYLPRSVGRWLLLLSIRS